MATNFDNAAQRIVYGLLNGNLTDCNVWDTAPALPEAMPNDSFPYCVIGDDTSGPWDTDDTLGAEITLTLHFWSRAVGKKEVKGLMGEAYALLNRASISESGYHIVDCLYEFGETMNDPDGKTKHGVQRYRLTIQEA